MRVGIDGLERNRICVHIKVLRIEKTSIPNLALEWICGAVPLGEGRFSVLHLTRRCTTNGLDFYIYLAALLFLSPSWELLSLHLSIQCRIHKELIACKFLFSSL
jgi:hypothetical protein